MSTYWGQSFPNYHTSIHVCRLVGETCHNHTPQIGLTTEKMSQKRLASMAWNSRFDALQHIKSWFNRNCKKGGDVSLHLVPSVQHQRSRELDFSNVIKNERFLHLKLTRAFPIILTLCYNQCHLNNMRDHLPSLCFRFGSNRGREAFDSYQLALFADHHNKWFFLLCTYVQSGIKFQIPLKRKKFYGIYEGKPSLFL